MKNLNNIIARSQRLMLDENWNRQVEMGAAAQRAGSLSGKGGGTNDLAALEAMAFGSAPSTPTPSYTPIPENFRAPRNPMITDDGKPIQILHEERAPERTNSKIPKAILESYKKTPSPTADSMGMMSPPASYYQPQTTAPRQPIVEQQYVPQQYVPQPQGGGIDYGYIKYMIEEAVNNCLRGQLNEGLNLSELKGMRIGPGSVIQLLDTKGNLYEGKLTLKKRAKT